MTSGWFASPTGFAISHQRHSPLIDVMVGQKGGKPLLQLPASEYLPTMTLRFAHDRQGLALLGLPIQRKRTNHLIPPCPCQVYHTTTGTGIFLWPLLLCN